MRISTIIVFVLISLGGGLLIGMYSAPDAWYAALNKPAFNPPSWVFAPVWSLLYILIGIAGARVWSKDLNNPVRLWFTQMVLNFLWTPMFFVFHRPDLALAVILILAFMIVSFIVSTWNRDRTAAWLFVPYLAWVSFASVLNFSIWRLNP